MKSTTVSHPLRVAASCWITAALLTLIALGINSLSAEDQYRSAHDGTAKSTMVKVNLSPMLKGEYSLGLEQKLSLNTSYYVQGGWIHKTRADIDAAGVGLTGGVRFYHKLPKRLRKGKAKGPFSAFSANYISLEGRLGRMRSLDRVEGDEFDLGYQRFAVHYGIQRAWKRVFINLEFGPSWGESDFVSNSKRGYYLDGFNMDGKFALGLAF